MEKENFITYAQAVALKELGFDEECLGLFYGASIKEEPEFILEFRSSQNSAKKGYIDAVLAPLFQQAFRWFREKHNLHQIVLVDHKGKYDIITGEKISGSCLGQYDTYEEAELACLIKLIEISKSKL